MISDHGIIKNINIYLQYLNEMEFNIKNIKCVQTRNSKDISHT